MHGDRDNSSPTSEQTEASTPQVTPDSASADFTNETTKEPSPNDVLCGRGGSINSHPGNERFRTLVEKRKRVYLTARFKREKRLIASSIVSEIRGLDPPGRFLQQDKKSGLWKDIGDEKARDKTSQALRENAPTIRAEIETEINEQRAELKKEEQEAQASATTHMPPQSSPSYYQGAWGPSYHSYYGYSHHAPPPPPHPHGHPGHPGYYPPPPHEGHWGYYPPPPHGHPHHRHPPPPPKSAFEQTADYISSGAESIKRWTEESLSLGGSDSRASRPSHRSHHSRSADGDETHETSGNSVGSALSKPLSYVHNDDSKKRRMVKFRSDTKRVVKRAANGRASALPSTHSVMSGNSLLDNAAGQHDIEPQGLDEEQNSTLMDQVATQILGSIGSWDAASILCGNDAAEKPAPAFRVTSGPQDHDQQPHEQEDEMAVEWEGQEVQLVDRTGNENEGSVASEERMPPPSRAVPDQQSSVGYSSAAFSSLGSCHSWLPEQFSTAASYFSGRAEEVEGGMDMEGPISVADNQSGMMLGDHSATSIGGASLTRVFENEAMPDAPTSMMPEQGNTGQRVLAAIPSWERSLRSKSPLSIESDDEDVSLISKESSKLSAENYYASQSQQLQQEQNGMVWERKE